jgi:hypothetical protein
MTDRYLPLALKALQVGRASPVDVWNPAGVLLLARGHKVRSERQLHSLQSDQPMVDEADYQALVEQGRADDGWLRPGTGPVEGQHIVPRQPQPWPTPLSADAVVAWPAVLDRLTALLYHPQRTPKLGAGVADVAERLVALADASPDESLFMLVQLLHDRRVSHSASRALLVALLCHLLVPALGRRGLPQRALLHAALTMNLGMTALQDQLVRQHEAPTPEQQQAIQQHPQHSVRLLRAGGVVDDTWLRLVQWHHEAPAVAAGSQAGQRGVPLAQRILTQADLLVARISPRAVRGAISPKHAVLHFFLDCNEADRALAESFVKTLTLYPPGSYVQLRSGEKAVVLRRGERINQPLVLALVNPKGALLPLPVVRDTSASAYAVDAMVPAETMRIRLDPSRILKRA